MMECNHIREDGEVCQAQAITNDEYCFAHSQVPEIVEKRQAAKVLGGQNGRKAVYQPASEEVKVKSSTQVLQLLEQTINDVRMNRIAVNQANCVGYLCNVMAKVFEQEMLETRIAILERTVTVTQQKKVK